MNTFEQISWWDRIEIKNSQELKERLWLTYDVQILDFDTPFRTTQEALYYLRASINNIADQQAKTAEIQKFIHEQRENIQADTRDGLSGMLAWAWLTAWATWVWGMGRALMNAYDTAHPKASTWDRVLHRFSTFSKVVWYTWKKFIYEKMPTIAKWFWMEEPKNPLQEILGDEVQENVQHALQNWQERIQQAWDYVEKLTHSRRATRIVFFNFFSPHNETMDEKIKNTIDRKKYNQVVHLILNSEPESHHPKNTTFFDNLSYAEFLHKETLIPKIYDKISQHCKDMTEEEKQKYIEIFIANIVWGQVSNNFYYTLWGGLIRLSWGQEYVMNIQGGSQFIQDSYRTATGKDITQTYPSPTMKEVFETLWSLWQFGAIFWWANSIQDIDISSINTDSLIQGLQGKDIVQIFESGHDAIKNMNEDSIVEILTEVDNASWLNRHNFKSISQAIFDSDRSRTLGNGFTLGSGIVERLWWGNIDDPQQENGQIVKDFLLYLNNFWRHLIWNLRAMDLIPADKTDNDIWLKDIYTLFLMTWGEGNIERLDPIKKCQLMIFCQLKYKNPGAQWVGALTAQSIEMTFWSAEWLLEKLEGGDPRFSGVKNFLEAIGRFMKRIMYAIGDVAKDVFVWIWNHNKMVAIGLVAVVMFAPVFSKRTNLFNITTLR